ncbi:glutamine--tRNA ligase [Ancylostoma caninum]|uniref:glutamate--tRNA ligase n=1 Tax=Ancylostoma caninum TaxID=29170 RepID=A0A368FRT5_ANCCA|nr:glutamine--tRNA ligase [Ancylostoma caninum]
MRRYLKLQKKFSTLFDAVIQDRRFAPAHAMVGKFAVETGKQQTKEKQKDEGKFVELPGAEKGKVVVRFPPEASGYLHIGHAKAALLNQYYQQTFDGQLIMRFDDTNPAKENAHFEKVIKEDLAMLNVIPDRWTHSSDHFEVMLQMCEKLLKEGKAYVDDTDTETMRKEREERVESKNRSTTPEANLALWEEMKKGTERGMQCCVRIKIDMQSNNGAMRDPTIYRCKPEEHVRTGMKYKVYPTYDFACPIVDSIEGVTHALRTTEYHDRDDQYYFICDALGLRKPYIWSYARLNMTNTVMSKRKLTWFVNEGLVEGWDDPRFPTVRGVMRRGMTVEGLRQFIIAQGVVMMEWDKIWSFNKKVIDPIAPRYTALDSTSLVPVFISTPVSVEEAQVPLHPKNPEVGTKTIWRSAKLLVEQVDAREMKSGDTVTFVNWGNIKIMSVEKTQDTVTQIHAVLDLANQDFKKTMKVTWIAEADAPPAALIPVMTVDYDHIISKAIIAKEEDWKNYINYDSVHYTKMVGEPALLNVKKGDIIQLQRKGFYICDHEHQKRSEFSGVETPLLLIYIPDGHVKETANKAKQWAHVGDDSPVVQDSILCRVQYLRWYPMTIVADSQLRHSCYSTCATESISEVKIPAGAVQNATAAPASTSADTLALYKAIEAQGNTVRTLKGEDPKSDATKQAVQKLLELKKQYKEATGQEYKPGQAPEASTPVAAVNGDASAAGLYKEIEAQGEIVRSEKAKDPKSEASKAAIAKLLDLKKQYKEKTGQEYKPGQAPAAPTPAANGAPSNASSLYSQIEAQGELVRKEKAKDAKSEAAKAAIAKLLELKKQYKDATGQEYKPGQAAAASNASVTATPAVSGSVDASALYAEIEAQGDLVRKEKAKDAKSEAAKSAIAKLLELKKTYKETTGQDYKPGQPPAANATAAAPDVAGDASALYNEIQAQGELVRKEKAKDAKSVHH